MRRRKSVLSATVLVAVVLGGARPVSAQEPIRGEPGPTATGTTQDGPVEEVGSPVEPDAGYSLTGPTLPADHWAVKAVERASMLLLVADNHFAQQALPLEVVEEALREAEAAAADRSPELQTLVAGWNERLSDEFGGMRPPGTQDDGPLMLRSRLGVGTVYTKGAAAPGLGEFSPHRSGAIPLEDRRSPITFAHLSGAWTRRFSVDAYVETDFDKAWLKEVEVAAGFGSWRASVGRKPVGYGSGPRSGIILSGRAPLDAVQLGTRRALALPGILRPLGSASLHTFLGRMTDDRHADRPYIWGASIQLQPSRRFTLGVNRMAMFGGDEPVTARRLASMLIGRVDGVGFENQIVSVSGRLVLPTEEFLPATVYAEWGAEDAAGSWWAVPGIIAGITFPSVPRVPGLALGGEYAHFGTSCCGNPSWYRHWSFHGAWAAGDQPLGHPLGGNGRQATVFLGVDLSPEARIEGDVFVRDRKSENLYAPEREGRSFGLSSSVDVRWSERWRLRLMGSHEAGETWSESSMRMEVSVF